MENSIIPCYIKIERVTYLVLRIRRIGSGCNVVWSQLPEDFESIEVNQEWIVEFAAKPNIPGCFGIGRQSLRHIAQ